MIQGIGVDLIEIDRINQSIKRNQRFVQRILTPEEFNIYTGMKEKRQHEFLAGRFAAKEAVAKAFHTGIGKLSFQDIEILPNPEGAPRVRVKGYEKLTIWVSISHSLSHAMAQVIVEER
ncbi:holo-ACP synthase [Halobacillus salinarum]|uniref:Holo-[acyl-carrier-protein] synthase n=1 Tax=Halobacillus salinarum TaxID=2932257 RepID=A0ABY4EJU7_9BACI|nr:holo-ACP synthase [Halobacillus salinarum]UOQ44353.1 holo-ACP synthase [Halobacillus salinarum]